MIIAIGLIEFSNITRGIEATDAMVKAANVDLLLARPTCPGKYTTLVSGDVGAVRTSVQAGMNVGEDSVIDQFVLPNVHEGVLPAITATTDIGQVKALGVIETFTVASAIVAADAALKAAVVDYRIALSHRAWRKMLRDVHRGCWGLPGSCSSR